MNTEEKSKKAAVEAKNKAEAELKAAVEAKNKAETAVTVVIPYVRSLALGEELKFAIASWKKLFRTPFNIVVIGDEEEYLKNEEDDEVPVTHIAHVRTSDNPQTDLMEKLKIAIAVPEVADRFIFAADDIYLVSPITLVDIQTLKISGMVNEKSYTGVKAENYKRTADLLRISSYPCYEARLPVVFEKEKWIELLEAYPQLNEGGYFFTSVYFRHFFPDFVPVVLNWNEDIYLLPVLSARPDEMAFRKFIHQKKFLTTAKDGFSKFLQNYLACLYNRKGWMEL
jgi:hypothetical protein